MSLLEKLRRQAGVYDPELAREPREVGLQTPRIALAARAAPFKSLDGTSYQAQDFDVATRMISMQRAHRAVPSTGGLNLGVATQVGLLIPTGYRVRRTPPARCALPTRPGLVSVGAVVRQSGGEWIADSAVLFRTARRLMQGEVAVPAAAMA